MNKDWDLNIFFKEVWDEHLEEYVLERVLTINPVIYMYDSNGSNNHYSDIIWTTTFAEACYLRSQYPVAEYGYDWTETITNFIEIAPPRLKSLAMALPSAYDYKIDLVG
jgi:hypothetical protein